MRLAAFVLGATLLACSPKLDWREFRSPEGGYVVALPDKPQSVVRTLTVHGHAVEMTMTSTGVGPTLFGVGVARLPLATRADAAARAATLAYFRDALVRNIDGTVLESAPARLARVGGSIAGERLLARGRIGASGRAAQLVARLVLVDDRLYQVVALSAEGELPPEALDTFFASFKLMF
jgi:hypothetical protein